METIEKLQYTSILKLKADIKKQSDLQRFLKNQRKTINLIGKREMNENEATWKHMLNREKLRIMYAAYGLMRGKTFSQIENNFAEKNHPLNDFKSEIDIIIEISSFKQTVNI